MRYLKVIVQMLLDIYIHAHRTILTALSLGRSPLENRQNALRSECPLVANPIGRRSRTNHIISLQPGLQCPGPQPYPQQHLTPLPNHEPHTHHTLLRPPQKCHSPATMHPNNPRPLAQPPSPRPRLSLRHPRPPPNNRKSLPSRLSLPKRTLHHLPRSHTTLPLPLPPKKMHGGRQPRDQIRDLLWTGHVRR